MSKKILQGLLEEFPDWDKEEVAEFVEALVSTVRKFNPQARKFEKVQVTGPKRNLIFISKALVAAREAMGPEMTQKRVTELAEWSSSKLIRIEAGTSVAGKADIMFLAGIYALSPAKTQELIAKRKG